VAVATTSCVSEASPRAAPGKPRRAQTLGNGSVAAHRTFDEAAALLAQEIVFGRKPAFKHMLVATLKIQNFHGAIIQR